MKLKNIILICLYYQDLAMCQLSIIFILLTAVNLVLCPVWRGSQARTQRIAVERTSDREECRRPGINTVSPATSLCQLGKLPRPGFLTAARLY